MQERILVNLIFHTWVDGVPKPLKPVLGVPKVDVAGCPNNPVCGVVDPNGFAWVLKLTILLIANLVK